MPDYDSNMIKPVDGLQNITGLAPARRREQRSRRQKFQQHERQEKERQQFDESVTEQPQENEKGSTGGKIDFCA